MKSKRDALDYIQLVATIAASILVPLILAYFGNLFIASQNERTNAIVESQNKQVNALKYVELAVGILRADPKEQDAGLRSWAIEVLASQSIVPLTDSNRKALLKNKINYHGYAYGGRYWTPQDSKDYFYNYFSYKNPNIDYVEYGCKDCKNKVAK